jgi:ABC-type bacteriocin/lantibiotic exporter with double-glycine peptidase domain
VTLNDVIQIVFIILKLCKLIDWSWWLVLIPFWVALGYLVIQSVVISAKYNRTKEQK